VAPRHHAHCAAQAPQRRLKVEKLCRKLLKHAHAHVEQHQPALAAPGSAAVGGAATQCASGSDGSQKLARAYSHDDISSMLRKKVCFLLKGGVFCDRMCR
jgi:hypothetical protein